jgi:hypothetical protein
MSDERFETIVAAAQAGDREACLRGLEELRHEERRALAPRLKKLVGPAGKLAWERHSDGTWAALHHIYETLVIAALVTSVPSELALFERHRPPLEAADALIRIAPPWLREAAEALAAVSPDLHALARVLVRRGASDQPTHDNYIVGLYTDTRFGTHPFDADPAVLHDEVWRMFEVEGSGERSLAARDKYTWAEKSWQAAFLRHLELGNLDRARVLDATLGALGRDFAPFRAGWYSRFHDTLAPTPEETTARTDTYLRLLSSAVPATATLALRVVKSIDGRAALPTATLANGLAPLLLSRHKGTAIAALTLLRGCARRSADDTRLVTAAATDALAHEATDVQKAALDLFDEHRASVDEATRQRIEEAGASVAPSLRKRLVGWSSSTSKTTTADDSSPALAAVSASAPAPPTTDSPTPTVTHATWDPLAAEHAVVPLTSLDELVRELSAALEDDGDPDRIERVLAGVAAWGPLDEAGARLAQPLAKRAKSIKRWALEKPMQACLVGLARAWTAHAGGAAEALASAGLDELSIHQHAPALAPLFVARVGAVVHALEAGKKTALWSTPTHRGGHLDPRVLVARCAESSGSERVGGGLGLGMFVGDFALALLRLAPNTDARAEALAALLASAAHGEPRDALCHALGGDAPIGPTAALWAAAARARSPGADDATVEAKHPALGPDAAHAARFSWSVKARTSAGYTFHDVTGAVTPKLPTKVPIDHLATRRIRDGEGAEAAYTRWSFTAWPLGAESFFGTHFVRLANNLGWWEARWHDHAVFALLNAPSAAFGPARIALLAAGLGAKEPGQQGLCVDAAIAAIEDGRLGEDALGRALAELRATGLITLKRWSVALARVAGASPRHALVIARALQHTFRGDATKPPRDELSLLALLIELLAQTETRVDDPEAWAYLRAGKHKAKIAAYAPE